MSKSVHVPQKSQRRLDEMTPCALEYRNGEGGGDQKGSARSVRTVKPIQIVTNHSFGDFGGSFVATVVRSYERRGGPRLSVRGRPLSIPTRGPLYSTVPPMQDRPTAGFGS